MKQIETENHIITVYPNGLLEILFKASGYVMRHVLEKPKQPIEGGQHGIQSNALQT